MDIITGATGKYRKLILAGQLWERDDIAAINEYVDICIQVKRAHIVIDLDRLTFINSQAIGLIVKIFKRCLDAGGHLILYRPHTSVKEVLEITGLTSFITVVHSDPELKDAMN